MTTANRFVNGIVIIRRKAGSGETSVGAFIFMSGYIP